MKTKSDAIIKIEQAIYLDDLHPKNTGILAEMEADAFENRVPIADREVASFIAITAHAIRAKRVLEIGMAIGYAVVHLLQAMDEDGVVVTIEPSDVMIGRASDYLTRAGLINRVEIKKGYALDVLPKLNDTFDMIYLDAMKEEYSDYLDLALPLLRIGGIVIADNLLWGGRVATGNYTPDYKSSTEGLIEFNKKFVNHPQLKAEILSVGDGLGYGVKTS
jgi:predicted O-methyltransferase YrrM